MIPLTIKDTEDLAIQMEKMIQLGRTQRIRMGEKGREKVIREFDEAIVISRYKTATENILQQR